MNAYSAKLVLLKLHHCKRISRLNFTVCNNTNQLKSQQMLTAVWKLYYIVLSRIVKTSV